MLKGIKGFKDPNQVLAISQLNPKSLTYCLHIVLERWTINEQLTIV